MSTPHPTLDLDRWLIVCCVNAQVSESAQVSDISSA